MGKSEQPLQHAQSDARHPPFAKDATSKLVETQADHGTTTLKEVQAAAVTTAVAGGTEAEQMHCTAYIKLLKCLRKCIMQKGSACGDTMQFPY